MKLSVIIIPSVSTKLLSSILSFRDLRSGQFYDLPIHGPLEVLGRVISIELGHSKADILVILEAYFY